MDDATIMVLLVVVVGAAFMAGFAFGAATITARVEGALKLSSQLDGELAAVISAQLAANRAISAALPQLEASAARQDAPGEHLERVAGATSSAANDALGAPHGDPGTANPPLFGTGKLLGRAGAPKRPCSFCARVRALLGL